MSKNIARVSRHLDLSNTSSNLSLIREIAEGVTKGPQLAGHSESVLLVPKFRAASANLPPVATVDGWLKRVHSLARPFERSADDSQLSAAAIKAITAYGGLQQTRLIARGIRASGLDVTTLVALHRAMVPGTAEDGNGWYHANRGEMLATELAAALDSAGLIPAWSELRGAKDGSDKYSQRLTNMYGNFHDLLAQEFAPARGEAGLVPWSPPRSPQSHQPSWSSRELVKISNVISRRKPTTSSFNQSKAQRIASEFLDRNPWMSDEVIDRYHEEALRTRVALKSHYLGIGLKRMRDGLEQRDTQDLVSGLVKTQSAVVGLLGPENTDRMMHYGAVFEPIAQQHIPRSGLFHMFTHTDLDGTHHFIEEEIWALATPHNELPEAVRDIGHAL